MFDLPAFIKANRKENKKFRIKLLGDSITHGMGGSGFEQNGENFVGNVRRNLNGYCWANMFKDNLESNFGCEVVNNGMSGTNVEGLIFHFEKIVDEEDDFIICMIGTNNRHQYMKTGAKKSVEEMSETFYQNILTLHNMLKKKNKKHVFMANIPAGKKNEEDGVDYWRILHMNDINDIYKRAQKTAGFEFISLYDLITAYMKEKGIEIDALLADGLHPNDKGYDVMYELIRKEFNV